MANFAINQVRHFYVAKDASSIVAKGSKDKSTLTFIYTGPDGSKSSTDVINVKDILYAKKTLAADMEPKFNTVTIKVDKAIVGQEYVIKVNIRNYAGVGDDSSIVKYGMFTATTTNASDVAEGLRNSLKKNMKDLVVLPEVGGSGANITITEVMDTYKVGVKPFRKVAVSAGKDNPKVNDITLFPIVENSVETTAWATITEKAEPNGTTNGYLIADMEWFYSGARGDMYREYGHPHGVKTELVANTASAYDTIDIHYAYVGPNEGAQKSEKTITFAGVSGALKSVEDALAELGISGFDADSTTTVFPASSE